MMHRGVSDNNTDNSTDEDTNTSSIAISNEIDKWGRAATAQPRERRQNSQRCTALTKVFTYYLKDATCYIKTYKCP